MLLLLCGAVSGIQAAPGSAQQQQQQAAPAGMVTGAYGFSLLPHVSSQQAQPSAATSNAAANLFAALATTAHAVPANSNIPSLSSPQAFSSESPAPALDPVSRFLQERGLVAQAETGGLLNQVRDRASGMVLSAMNFLGVRYTRGGSSVESGFDCSGFTRHIFELSVGLVLPRRADEQAKMASLLQVKKTELKPGDLVFFNTMRRTFSHVGIYVGEGKFIHSPRVGGAVRVEDMREAYWAKRFTGARRADLNAAAATGNAAK